MFNRPISALERRTIRLGLSVSLIALTIAYGAVPFLTRWQAREEVIASEVEHLARLRGLVANEAQLSDLVRSRAAAVESGQQRLLTGRTPALAASTLQSLIQRFADESRVTVSRLDVAGAPDAREGAFPMIPATVSAVGDIYGITDMLSLLQHGSLLLEIDELTVRPNPALRGGLLQMMVTLRGPYLGG